MDIELARVFFRDGHTAWTTYDEPSLTVDAVLWPSCAKAEAATRGDRQGRLDAASRMDGTVRTVHVDAGSFPMSMAGLEPVVIEACGPEGARWWTGLADRAGQVLVTNRCWNEVNTNHAGLFREHPFNHAADGAGFGVTGVAWDEVDFSDVDADGPPPYGARP